MVFVEVGSPYILAGAQIVFSCRSVWKKISCPCSAIIAFTPRGAQQSIFGIWTWLFLHLIAYFKEKKIIVLGVCKKKY